MSLKRDAVERPHTDLTMGEVADRAAELGPRLTAAAREHFDAGTTLDYDRGEAERALVDALATEDVYVLRAVLHIARRMPLTFRRETLASGVAEEVLDRLDAQVHQALLAERAETAWCDIQAAVARLATLPRTRHIGHLEAAAGALTLAVELADRPDMFAPESPL